MRFFGRICVLIALVIGFLSYLVLTGQTVITPTHDVVTAALLVNGLVAVILALMIVISLIPLISQWRQQQAGIQFHWRIVGLFSFIAVVPALVVALIASITLDSGLDRWFAQRVRVIIGNSVAVAQAYQRAHADNLRTQLITMSNDLSRATGLLSSNPIRFRNFLTTQTILRNFKRAVLFDERGTALMRAGIHAEVLASAEILDAIEGTPETGVILVPGSADTVAGVARLRGEDRTFLYAERAIDPSVLVQIRALDEGVLEYRELERRRYGVQVAFALIYVSFALILLLAAIWVGLEVAARIMRPIRELIQAAGRVSNGDLTVRLSAHAHHGDVRHLSAAFNRMVVRLDLQRSALVEAQEQIKRRTRFSEAVLSGVTAGVIGLDSNENVMLINRSAQAMMKWDAEEIGGLALKAIAPEFHSALTSTLARESERKDTAQMESDEKNWAGVRSPTIAPDQVIVAQEGREDRIFQVSWRAISEHDPKEGSVITFDDISMLIAAQQAAAWTEVARRVAHEIKNPLTPIQLAAERLRRKFGPAISSDQNVFEQCIETIVRQVGDLERIVNEFSAFAQLQRPQLETENLGQVVRDVIILFRTANPRVRFELFDHFGSTPIRFDRRLISQVITNLLKNSLEALVPGGFGSQSDQSTEVSGQNSPCIQIEISNEIGEGMASVEVRDNGPGFEDRDRKRFLEPYSTTRKMGTGLGLAIVRAIVEAHRGYIDLFDRKESGGSEAGALVRVQLPLEPADAEPGAHSLPSEHSDFSSSTQMRQSRENNDG